MEPGPQLAVICLNALFSDSDKLRSIDKEAKKERGQDLNDQTPAQTSDYLQQFRAIDGGGDVGDVKQSVAIHDFSASRQYFSGQ